MPPRSPEAKAWVQRHRALCTLLSALPMAEASLRTVHLSHLMRARRRAVTRSRPVRTSLFVKDLHVPPPDMSPLSRQCAADQ